MLTRLFFYPTEGHNGYLDVINDLGLVGGCCLLGDFVHYVRTSLRLFKLDRYQAGLYLTLLFRGFVADMSESHWFSVLTVDFVIMTLATAALARSLIQARVDAAAGRAARQTPAPSPGHALVRPGSQSRRRSAQGQYRSSILWGIWPLQRAVEHSHGVENRHMKQEFIPS